MFYLVFRSPGVIITEIHKRGGMDDEEYSKVSASEENVTRSPFFSRTTRERKCNN